MQELGNKKSPPEYSGGDKYVCQTLCSSFYVFVLKDMDSMNQVFGVR